MITREARRVGWVLLAFLAACDGAVAEVWIAPDGNDGHPGTQERPFATLEGARAALREMGPDRGHVTVYVRGGRYTLDHAFVLDERDSDVTFVAAPGERPVISGGRIVTGWRAENGRMVAHVDFAGFRQVWIDGVRAPRARQLLESSFTLAGDLENIDGVAGYEGSEFPGVANPSALELGYFMTWQHKICGVQRIARTAQSVRIDMRQPCFYLVTHHVRSVSTPSYVENAPELIDEPGEWYYDREQRELIVLPPTGVDLASAEVIVPVLEQLVVIHGARDIRFEGLTFAETGWMRPSTYGHPDVQANFISDTRDPSRMFMRNGDLVNQHDEYWKSPGAVRLDGTHAITFERCTFTRLGGAGVDLERGASNNVIRGSRFSDIAANGIQVGDVRTDDHHPGSPELVLRGNQIVNNVIRTVGAQYEDSVGIFVGYTDGTVIANNDLGSLPYTAISVGWGWGETDAGGGAYMQPFFYDTPTPSGNNQIVHNEIHDILQRRTDGGAIYTLGNQPGTVIASNHIHRSIGYPGGVYLDEGSGFIEVVGNSAFDVPEPYFPHNFVQDRNATCNVHDNFFGMDVDVGAGLTAEYRDLLDD
jgi:hypothetical protein